ncbi:hypothetical protein PN480_18760 [Dolichospermum circinale CS-1225]|uniref:Transposase n=1 Tax=Dolichospermum circinale CS-537/01 TaxID=3021739 RepID=A0ABT5A4N5_9CYAN|nr:hypothetical protein [Dolichospermum circinale]MDB9459259.1 hypothetical protein [Dolichospermum circinale CS-545/17]MDB9486894.1 hypothetical protein [Dolichospermum circinale CS-537/01]MDB9523969.1 hypothetical protein [Dolichospermum circinale CS-1225]
MTVATPRGQGTGATPRGQVIVDRCFLSSNLGYKITLIVNRYAESQLS